MSKKMFLLFLMITMALTACADSSEEPAQAPEAANEVAAAPTEAPAEPTAVPTEAPAEPAAPTDAPAAEATAEPTAVPVAAAETGPDRVGILRFRNNDAVPSGDFQLLLEGIAAPAAGTHYELWVADDSLNTLNLGEFAVNSTVNYTDSTLANLLGTYNSAFISIEPDGVADGEIGPIAYNGVVPAGSLLHIRHLLTAFPANPESKAFLVGAEEQLLQATEHAGLLAGELANGNIREAQRHAEHVINILDGETGPNFGDLDGDTIAQNPGDGFGVRAYLDGAKEHAQLAADAEDATAEVLLHTEHVLISSDNTLAQINAVISEAMRVIASDSAAEAQPAADEMLRLLDIAYNGQDANGDGSIAPIANEGALLTAVDHAFNMGSFEFFPADGAAVAAPAAEHDAGGHGDTEAATAVPVQESTAVPVQESTTVPVQEPGAPTPVTIEMVNFAFQPGDITIPAGTAVTWVNKDNGPRHSATASDGSFDTGLLDANQQATITFDTPGTYVYYCTLHGSPDGSGMAAVITVTE